MISGFAALLFRSVWVLLCVAGTRLTWKERLFCVIAYLPKAMLMVNKEAQQKQDKDSSLAAIPKQGEIENQIERI